MSDATSSFWLWLILIFIIFSRFSSAEQKTITAEPGQNVALTCRAPNINSDPKAVVEWSRSDLKKKEYVLLYRDKHFDKSYQHPSFKDRVDLQDKEMKDGDASLTLKNVSVNDTGTYECRVMTGTKRKKRANLSGDPISIIYLSVSPPGQPGGTTEDGGKQDGSVGLIIGLSVLAVLLLVAVLLIHISKRCRKRHGLDPKQPPDDQQLDSFDRDLQTCKENLLIKVEP